jgi:Protein of unknown function (DUF433)
VAEQTCGVRRVDAAQGGRAAGCGSTAEEILLKYPSLNLTDIYAVITYYLWSREEVEAYLEERRRQEEAVRRESETRFPSAGIRGRLLARSVRQV